MGRSIESRRQTISNHVAALSIDQLGAKGISGKDVPMNGRDVAWLAGREVLGNGFKGMDRTARNGKNGNGSSENLAYGTATLETSELTPESTAMDMLLGDLPQNVELTLPKTKTKQVSVKLEEPSLRGEKRGVRLEMLLPENGKEVDEGKLAAEFFGHGRRWLAARANPAEFERRELEREQRILGPNPSKAALDKYRKSRNVQIEEWDRHATRSTNLRFEQAVRERFDLNEQDDPMEFADDQIEHATAATRYMYDTLYPYRGALSQRNEAVLPIVSPAEVVKTIASPDTDETLKFEARRRLLLAHISGEIDSQNRSREAARKLARIQALLDRELFSGRIASTSNIKIRALFDNETNAVQFVDKVDGEILNDAPIPDGTHVKTCEVPMRPVKGTEWKVLTNPNQKREDASIIKAVKKGIDNKEKGRGSLIAGAEEVQDIHRIKFAVLGDTKMRDELMLRVYDILVDNQRDLAELDVEGRPIANEGEEILTGIYPDDKTNGRKGQSKNVNFRRIQVQFKDLPSPVEIIFQDIKGFLTTEYEVGTFDKDKGEYEGASHRIYSIQRLMEVRPYIFPQSIYTRVNLAKEAIKTLKAEARELLSLKRGRVK